MKLPGAYRLERTLPLAAAVFLVSLLPAGDCPAVETATQQHSEMTATGAATAESSRADAPSDAPMPQPVCNVRAEDVPNDAGGAIRVMWDPPTGGEPAGSLTVVEVMRYSPGETPVSVGDGLSTDLSYVDDTAESRISYQYFIRSLGKEGHADSEASDAATATAQWFNMGRLSILVATLLFCGAVLVYLQKAKGGAELFVRKIPGLEAVDDAVGRATEMGRPVLYVPGIETVSEVGTLAALTILGHVARRVAQHGTPLEVPCADPIVMTTAQEIVKSAYVEVGQPDSYDPSKVAYLTYDQFGYTAGVDGMMVRDRPEAVFLLGTFYAESLILAETGHAIGAIQIAGTKETSQLPFFVAACDYTLIGEELFAASSYLSREPVMLGSLKGQDLAKMWIVYVIVFAFVVGTAGALIRPDGSSFLTTVFDFVASWFD